MAWFWKIKEKRAGTQAKPKEAELSNGYDRHNADAQAI